MRTEPEYAELHCHSSYSLLDGASQPEELIGQARALGLRALALTDHDGLYIAPTFCRLAEAADLQPIVGAEVTLAGSVSPPPERAADPLPGGDLPHPPRPRRGTDPPTGGPGGVPPPPPPLHLTLLAADDQGYSNLCHLLSLAHRDQPKGEAALDPALLAEHSAGLLALSGWRHGGGGRPPLAR